MATSKELLKAQEAGAEIRITIAGQPEGGLVEYSPRHKGDHRPWVYQSGRYVTGGYRYSAKDVAAVTAPVVEETPEAAPVVTPEMIEALATLRGLEGETHPLLAARKALRTLYAAGVFAHIDAAADAKQERLLKGGSTRRADAKVAEQEQVNADGTVQCGHCRGDYKPKADGTLRKHACWKYDSELETTVFGPLDIHDRAARVAEQEQARREAIRRAVGLKF